MAYLIPDDPALLGLRHLILIGGGRVRHPVASEPLLPYVAELEAGRPRRWLFDTFCLWPNHAPSGRMIDADVNAGTTVCGEGDFRAVPVPDPADQADWEGVMDTYFGAGGTLAALDAAVDEVARVLGAPGALRNVVLTIPYPSPRQERFGRPAGRDLDFTTRAQSLDTATRARLEAVAWFTTRCRERFAAGSYRHLRLLGYYWTFETVYRAWDVDDHWLLKEIRRRLPFERLMWIPFYASYNVHLLDDYRSYYFDAAFLQPNHLFYGSGAGKTVERAARDALERGAGVELEYDPFLPAARVTAAERRRRFARYLDGGVQYGYMHDSALAWFDGGLGLAAMQAGPDPVERWVYTQVARFVHREYEPGDLMRSPVDPGA